MQCVTFRLPSRQVLHAIVLGMVLGACGRFGFERVEQAGLGDGSVADDSGVNQADGSPELDTGPLGSDGSLGWDVAPVPDAQTATDAPGIDTTAAPDAAADTKPEAPFVVAGSYVGDGIDGRDVALPFRPVLVLVRAFANAPTIWRSSTMTGDAAKDLSNQEELMPDLIEGFGAADFRVGAELNEGGFTYHYVAFSASPHLSVGTYTGSMARASVDLGAPPAYVMIVADGDWARARSATMPNAAGSFGFGFNNLDFAPQGFSVAPDTVGNRMGLQHHWVAWTTSDPRTVVSAYQGNGVDDRLIPTPVPPEAVFLQCTSAADRPGYEYEDLVWRPASLPPTTDRTFTFVDRAPLLPGHIQRLLPSGFEVGDRVVVNTTGRTCHYVAFAR